MALQATSDPSALLTTALEKLLYLESRLDSSQAALEEATRDIDRHRHAAQAARQALADWQRRATDAEVAAEGAEREVSVLRSSLAHARQELNVAPRETELSAALAGAEERLARFEREREVWLDRMVVLQRLGSGGDELDLGAFISELRAELLALRRGDTTRPRATVSDRPPAPDPATLLDEVRSEPVDPEEIIRNARLPRTDRTLATLCARDLRSDSPAVRRRAAERLAEGRLHELAPIAASLLVDEPDVGVRVALTKLVGLSPSDVATLALQRALADADPRVRATALDALAKRPDADISPALRDVSPAVRRRALTLMQGGRDGIDPLSDALRDEDASVRHVAAIKLAARPGVEATAILQVAAQSADVEVRDVARRVLDKRPAPAVVVDDVPEPPLPPPAAEVAPPEAPPAPEPEAAPPAMTPSAPALDLEIFADLRAALRGRTIEDLAEIFGQTVADVTAAADRLLATGRIVRRGKKLYQA